MRTHNSLISTHLGGGGSVTQDVAVLRGNAFCVRRRKQSFKDLQPPFRQAAVYCLWYYHGLSQSQLADLFGISQTTVKADIGFAQFTLRIGGKNGNNLADFVRRMEEYILYNAKYLPR